jgi:hypothetical protein
MAFSSNDPRNYLAIGKQSAKGTEATSFKFVRYLSGGVNVAQESESIYTGGDGQDVGLVYKARVRPDGEFDTYAWPDQFAYLSAYAMGSGVTPASVSDVEVATHIYTPNATIPYLTVEQAFGGGNAIDRVSDAIFSGLTIEGEAGMPWRISVPFVGGGTLYYRDGAASALTSVIESGDPAMFAGGAVLIDAATSLDVRKFTYAFERNVDGDLFTNQMFRREVVPLTRGLTVNMEVVYQDPDLYKKVFYGAGSVVPFNLATGAFHAERTLTASQLLAVDVPNLRYMGVELNRLEPDGQTLIYNVSAQAVKAGTGITQIRANITGRATSYLV